MSSEVKVQIKILELVLKSMSEGTRQQTPKACGLAIKYRLLLRDDLLFKEMTAMSTEMSTNDIDIGRFVCHFRLGNSFNDLVTALWAMKHYINHGNTLSLDRFV